MAKNLENNCKKCGARIVVMRSREGKAVAVEPNRAGTTLGLYHHGYHKLHKDYCPVERMEMADRLLEGGK